MVLVDSSIWIDYFRYGTYSSLEDLLNDEIVVINEIILSELIPIAIHKNQHKLVNSLRQLERMPLRINWEGIRMLQLANYQNGINRVGIPDLMIAQQAIQNKILLWSKDKHFQLMAEIMEIDLYTG